MTGRYIGLDRGENEIAVGASSSRPDGDDAGQPDLGATGKPGAVQPPPAPRPENDLVTIHITQATAVILSALAAERGVSVGGMVTVLTVDAAEAIGLGRLARDLIDD
jgi:hypothetical protein